MGSGPKRTDSRFLRPDKTTESVVCRQNLTRVQNKVSVVTCCTAFHEFVDPNRAVFNLISVLPERGITVLFDYSEEGWERQRIVTALEGIWSVDHLRQDLENARRWGLTTTAGIKTFWEDWFKRVPGQCRLVFSGDLYFVLYVAQQWGVIKPTPNFLSTYT